MCAENRDAAQDLLDAGRYRSSISRAYYATYAAIAGRLAERGVKFSRGRGNPDHADLTSYVLNNLPSLRRDVRFRINRALRRVFKLRIEADYVPAAAIDRPPALNALRDATLIIRALGVDDE